MSDDDLDEDFDETVDVEEDADEDQPSIDEDEMASFSEVSEQIEQAAADEDQEDDEDDQEESDEKASSTTSTDPSKTSVGDVYCNGLGMAATVARDRYGSGVDDREQQMSEYADMASQLELDDLVDDWMEEHGGVDEMSPGQGIMVMSTMFCAMVALEDPELVEGIGQEVAS